MSDANESASNGLLSGEPAPELVAAVKTVYDPDIPVDIYELGLIYGLEQDTAGKVWVKMTLTSPACPVAGVLTHTVDAALRQVDGVSDVDVELVWDPPWGQDRMSDEARMALNMFD